MPRTDSIPLPGRQATLAPLTPGIWGISTVRCLQTCCSCPQTPCVLLAYLRAFGGRAALTIWDMSALDAPDIAHCPAYRAACSPRPGPSGDSAPCLPATLQHFDAPPDVGCSCRRMPLQACCPPETSGRSRGLDNPGNIGTDAPQDISNSSLRIGCAIAHIQMTSAIAAVCQ
jgi:hypothetical protein